jgi:crossover junction endodeoxyribonuclease RuvC
MATIVRAGSFHKRNNRERISQFVIDISGRLPYLSSMRVLGIDPGLNITGYGILEADGDSPKVLEAGVLKSNPRWSLEERLKEMAAEMQGVIEQFRPDALAIEELYSHYNHPITAVVMGHVRGVLILKAVEQGIPITTYAATRIKKSLTGNGRATKEQMQRMVKVTLGLPNIPEPPDAADALAIALCHCRAILHSEGIAV